VHHLLIDPFAKRSLVGFSGFLKSIDDPSARKPVWAYGLGFPGED
jgi:hypothetical protein